MNFKKIIRSNKYFSIIKFIKKEKCNICHNIKKNQKIIPSFFNIIKNKKKKYIKKELYEFIRNGSKNNYKKNIIMPSFINIKKKYLYFFIKWLLNLMQV